jgi:hypothetical protein
MSIKKFSRRETMSFVDHLLGGTLARDAYLQAYKNGSRQAKVNPEIEEDRLVEWAFISRLTLIACELSSLFDPDKINYPLAMLTILNRFHRIAKELA